MQKLEALYLLELDSFLSVKERFLHSIVQNYCYIHLVIVQYYFYTFNHFLLGFLCRYSYCAPATILELC